MFTFLVGLLSDESLGLENYFPNVYPNGKDMWTLIFEDL